MAGDERQTFQDRALMGKVGIRNSRIPQSQGEPTVDE